MVCQGCCNSTNVCNLNTPCDIAVKHNTSVAKGECTGEDDSGKLSRDVSIQFLKHKCAIFCEVVNAQTIYWIKLLKEFNSTFYNVLNIHRNGEKNTTKWSYRRDMKSSYTDDGSDIYKGKLVLKLNSSDVHYFDKGIYKCEVTMENITSSVGLYWNTTKVNWAVTMANAQLQVKFVTNRLGNQNLVHNGFKFQAKNKKGIRTYWKCSTANCPATTNTLNNIPTKVSANHNHGESRRCHPENESSLHK
ncbi:unnamed protein product [Mytilus coruscus]|uniref:FLYWCH-type domain-containing protein n=1 Tax=Mytilus coruscus TaxID=42192 RepID=A0A6J8C6F7_MYTCO|nr:unnamed protein product [Mytilus coruscus]